MITRIQFSQHAFHGPLIDVTAEYRGEKLYYKIHALNNHDENEPDIYMEDFNEFSGDGKLWMSSLETIGVQCWENEYYAPVLDGTSWSLQIEGSGFDTKQIHGSNEWPEQFDEFVDILDELFSDLESKGGANP